jgi:hypothetical protein
MTIRKEQNLDLASLHLKRLLPKFQLLTQFLILKECSRCKKEEEMTGG